MSVTSAKTGSTSLSLALENNFMEPIASTLVGAGGVSTVTFNDIPQTYKHLQLRVTARNTRVSGYNAGTLTGYFNGDTGINYSNHYLYGDSGTIYSFSSLATSGFTVTRCADNSVANVVGVSITDILDYTNTNKYKTMRSITGIENNSVGEMQYTSNVWMSTTAVTSITIDTPTFNIMQHSRFSLYGIKG
jgi:hypothetical protein